DPAGEADAAVAHHDLAVRAKIGTPSPDLKQRERVEPRDRGASVAQRPEESAARVDRTGAVDNHADLDASARPRSQLVAQPAADLIVLPDVVLEVDVVLRCLDRCSERVVLGLAFGVELDGLRAQRWRLTGRDRDPRELLAVVGVRALLE